MEKTRPKPTTTATIYIEKPASSLSSFPAGEATGEEGEEVGAGRYYDGLKREKTKINESPSGSSRFTSCTSKLSFEIVIACNLSLM
jgi:hypothetical protein